MYTANMIVRFRSMKLNFYYGHSLTYIEIDCELEKKKKNWICSIQMAQKTVLESK